MPAPSIQKLCPVCGKSFATSRSSKIYCGGTCRSKAHKSRSSAGNPIAHPDYGERYCIVCGMPFNPASYPQKTCGIFCHDVNEYMMSAPYQRKRMHRIKATESPEGRAVRQRKAHDYYVEYYARNRDRIIKRSEENRKKKKESKNGR